MKPVVRKSAVRVDGAPVPAAKASAKSKHSQIIQNAAPEKSVNAGEELVELFASGISVSTAMGRPVLILKNKGETEVLPVWMNPLDAGVALAEMTEAAGQTPHAVTLKVLTHFQLKVESCTFVDLVGHHQFVQIKFNLSSNMPTGQVDTLRLRGDEAMSFCLMTKAKFFASSVYMARCRNLQAELGQFEQNLAQGVLPALQRELEMSSKKHPYVM